MEAVYVRDELLKLHLPCSNLKRPLDVVRLREDEFAKGDAKILQFVELKMTAGERAAVLRFNLKSPVNEPWFYLVLVTVCSRLLAGPFLFFSGVLLRDR